MTDQPDSPIDLATVEGLDRALLDSYLRIGCSQREALIAVGGDLLQATGEPGTDVEEETVRRYLATAGLTRDEVCDALGLRFDAAS